MEKIGEYLVRRLLGEGGMGKVFEAEERLSKRRVALKLLGPELARSEEGRRLFLNEMTILSQLDHPNVVRCLACSEVDDQLVMTLEYLEGQTLRQMLTERGPLEWSEAVSITVQVAQALLAAHGQKPPIVHRDLKPENIMVLSGGKVKVMDFGIAKVLEVMNKTTTQSVGTLQYMSPEQIDATGVDARSDLYCLGLILYEMLAGRPPFDAASPRQLLNQQCTEPPPALPASVRGVLPKGIERLLVSLLEKAPGDRPKCAEEVLRELEAFAPALGEPSERAMGVTDAAEATVRDGAASSRQERDGSAEVELTRRSTASGPSSGRTPSGVADTIALLDAEPSEREVSRQVAWATVIALSIAAGLVTYLVRSQPSAPGVTPARGADAAEGLARD